MHLIESLNSASETLGNIELFTINQIVSSNPVYLLIISSDVDSHLSAAHCPKSFMQ